MNVKVCVFFFAGAPIDESLGRYQKEVGVKTKLVASRRDNKLGN